MRETRVVVIGAGIGGLVAALELASRGFAVTIVDRAVAPGGKMRELEVAGHRIDAGPTVLTMRSVFDEVFAGARSALDAHVTLRPCAILARHAWGADGTLDLYADLDRSVEAIGDFAGAAEARRYRAFSEEARRIYAALEAPYLRSPVRGPLGLVRNAGLRGLAEIGRIRPFARMWGALGQHFRDPRLRQLFGRYATYCGSSPFLSPATLMLVAHVERDGVWLVEGGMHRLAAALAGLAGARGAALRLATEVAEVLVDRGRACGVRLASGERIEADAVVANADVAAIASGRLGRAAASAVAPVGPAARSLSALTWALSAATRGFPLVRHNVFFSGDYAAEFEAIFGRGALPDAPTVYVCAQDRDDAGLDAPRATERLLCLVNAPAIADARGCDPLEIERCEERTFRHLERCGVQVTRRPEATQVTTPWDFESLFPGTGGALYGRAAHGWRASFRRPGPRSRMPGLYLAGGSTHPGPGVPMAALSGRMAAAALMADRASMPRSRGTATPGGTSMH